MGMAYLHRGSAASVHSVPFARFIGGIWIDIVRELWDSLIVIVPLLCCCSTGLAVCGTRDILSCRSAGVAWTMGEDGPALLDSNGTFWCFGKIILGIQFTLIYDSKFVCQFGVGDQGLKCVPFASRSKVHDAGDKRRIHLELRVDLTMDVGAHVDTGSVTIDLNDTTKSTNREYSLRCINTRYLSLVYAVVFDIIGKKCPVYYLSYQFLHQGLRGQCRKLLDQRQQLIQPI